MSIAVIFTVLYTRRMNPKQCDIHTYPKPLTHSTLRVPIQDLPKYKTLNMYVTTTKARAHLLTLREQHPSIIYVNKV